MKAVLTEDYRTEFKEKLNDKLEKSVIGFLNSKTDGGLIEGLSVDEFFRGRSMPRNRELMRIFKDMKLVEHIGSGMNRILRAYDKSIFQLSERFIEVVFPFDADYIGSAEQVTEQVTQQVTTEVNTEVNTEVRKVIMVMLGEMSRSELMQKLELKNDEHFRKQYLVPALHDGFIEMTQPDSPKSPTQKYRLTAKGKQIRMQFLQEGEV